MGNDGNDAEELDLYGRDLFGEIIRPPSTGGALADRFGVPPFSVLNAREGEWQDRKRQWISLGIQSEVGRSADLTFDSAAERKAKTDRTAPGGSPMPAMDYSRRERGDGRGRALIAPVAPLLGGGGAGNTPEQARELAERYGIPEEGLSNGGVGVYTTATSIFDPVLCELVYKWFSAPGHLVVDPFAGGSVRGVVAGKLGRRYLGFELRPEQVEANRLQLARIAPDAEVVWTEADALVATNTQPMADLVFTCPPYGDLERYSDDRRDLSTMRYTDFLRAYEKIILRATQRLKPDRFACFVVGEFRDQRGLLRGFVADTINAFRDAGVPLYNEAILLTAIGSLPIRAGKIFEVSRKLGKTHQNILVFCKGDPEEAAAACR